MITTKNLREDLLTSLADLKAKRISTAEARTIVAHHTAIARLLQVQIAATALGKPLVEVDVGDTTIEGEAVVRTEHHAVSAQPN